MEYRIEKDSMGEMKVPVDALYGASTARAVANFPISGKTLPRSFIQALGWIKIAAAQTNADLGLLSEEVATAIIDAAKQVLNGEHDQQFVVDVFQTGSGTSTNMNANEVIAHIARLASDEQIHPNDHVNMGQSSNDVIPTATHLAVKYQIEQHVVPALQQLKTALSAKAVLFHDILKSGRTHLQDAVPISVGQEFAAYAWQVEESIRRCTRAAKELGSLALGGTAVGTGVNTHPDFAQHAIAHIAMQSGMQLSESGNHVAAQASPDSVLDASGAFRQTATVLMKIANDIRWMASGPKAGIGELHLPAVQPGSSIMPGKINPVIAESLIMVCVQVIGNDATVAIAAQSSNFELHTMWPLLADRMLDSADILARAVTNFSVRLVDGITVSKERCEELLLHNASIATVLVPSLGYDRVAALVHHANETGEQIMHTIDGRDDVYRVGDEMIPKSWLIGPHK